MRVLQYSVTHHRTGWWLSLSRTSLWRLHVAQLLESPPASWLGMRYLYRPWNWALNQVSGHHDRFVPIKPLVAKDLDPDFYREVVETFGDDLLADGSLRKGS